MASSEFGSSRPNRNIRDEEDESDEEQIAPFEDQTDLVGHSEMDLPEEEDGEDIMNDPEADYFLGLDGFFITRQYLI